MIRSIIAFLSHLLDLMALSIPPHHPAPSIIIPPQWPSLERRLRRRTKQGAPPPLSSTYPGLCRRCSSSSSPTCRNSTSTTRRAVSGPRRRSCRNPCRPSRMYSRPAVSAADIHGSPRGQEFTFMCFGAWQP